KRDVPDDRTFTFLAYHEADDLGRLRELLYHSGRSITVLEIMEKLAGNVGISTRWNLLKNLKRLGVKLRSQVRLIRIEEAQVIIETQTGQESIPADTIIMATGSRSVNDLAREGRELGIEVMTIGDAKEPRKIADAVREGFDAALKA
ncbi:MAG: NAD(P)/FAD-dependent oxidoreductase, partial [Syntrophales bacterium LBB04]|nr:NAD(P)/FAD-dependent oxidoreductase [Syntrophales bacterium LBB04]